MQFKNLLLALFLLASIAVSAQINKGAVLIGGNLSFSGDESDPFEQKVNRFAFSPAIGKAIKENLIAGIDFSYSGIRSSEGANSLYKRNSNRYGGGIFLRQYKVVAKNFYLFGQGRLGTFYQHDELRTSTSVDKSDRYGITFAIYPGLAYAITKKLQFEAGFPELFSLGYISGRSGFSPNNEPNKTRGFSVSTSLTAGTPLSIGMRLLLNANVNN